MLHPEPRAFTADECRDMMFEHMASCLVYWRDLPADRFSLRDGERSELHARMEGFLFSLLVMFDGGSGNIPALDISPAPHPDDEGYCRDTLRANWWPEATVINDTQMHEVFPWKRCRRVLGASHPIVIVVDGTS